MYTPRVGDEAMYNNNKYKIINMIGNHIDYSYNDRQGETDIEHWVRFIKEDAKLVPNYIRSTVEIYS